MTYVMHLISFRFDFASVFPASLARLIGWRWLVAHSHIKVLSLALAARQYDLQNFEPNLQHVMPMALRSPQDIANAAAVLYKFAVPLWRSQ